MSDSQVVSLRIPADLKRRLQREARYQGVTFNQLTSYLLSTEVARIESVSLLESRLSDSSIESLKKRAKVILGRVPSRKLPAWDRMD